MIRIVHLPAVLILFLTGTSLWAQDTTSFSFGKVTAADFGRNPPSFDPGAHAVILADVGSLKVITENNFGYEFTCRRRVKVLDKEGVEAGKFEIPVYLNRRGEGIEQLTAVSAITYNLENGKVVESRLDPKDIYTDEYSKTVHFKKFSLPQLKEGCVFEINYTIKSFYFDNLRPWIFQDEYPCQWSQFEVEVPALFDFAVVNQGYLPYYYVGDKEINNTYYLPGVTIKSNAIKKKWIIRDVPSLKEESFTTTIDNHRSQIEFQVSEMRLPDRKPILFQDNWATVKADLDKDYLFGNQLKEVQGSLNKILQPMLGAEAMFKVDRAKKIYNYVRDNYICTRRSGYLCSTGLKELLKTKRGNVADVNLLLVAMLREQLVDANPVILSTRSNGKTHPGYPIMDRFNYVICHMKIDSVDYFLDASSPDLGFGRLPVSCYNGHARVLTAEPIPVYLLSDTLKDKKVTLANLTLGNGKLNGRITTESGYFESLRYRESIREKGNESRIAVAKATFSEDFEPTDIKVDSFDRPELPLKISYSVSYDAGEEDVLYIRPFFVPFMKSNPFVSENRLYPVELPYMPDQTYILNFHIPEGYAVEEIPKSGRYELNDNEGMFEYLIASDATRIQLRSRLVLNRATFDPAVYGSLREFFSYVVRKQQEQIVLRKVKK